MVDFSRKDDIMPPMDSEHIKRRQKELSKQQAIYAAHRERGASQRQSAIMAGYSKAEETGVVANRVENLPAVQSELQKAREAIAKSSGITKEEVLQGLKDAAEMARTMADPQAMVRAWSEIGKMLGHYAEEKKKVTHELGADTIEALRGLPDSELLKLAKGRVIEGEVLEKKEEPEEEPDGNKEV